MDIKTLATKIADLQKLKDVKKMAAVVKDVRQEVMQLAKDRIVKPALSKSTPKLNSFYGNIQVTAHITKILLNLNLLHQNLLLGPIDPEEIETLQSDILQSFLALTKTKLTEATYPVLHDTLHSAIQTALTSVRKDGYTVDPDEEFNKVTTAYKSLGIGKTDEFHLELTKNGKPQKKLLHIQIYRMDTGRYELNFYVA